MCWSLSHRPRGEFSTILPIWLGWKLSIHHFQKQSLTADPILSESMAGFVSELMVVFNRNMLSSAYSRGWAKIATFKSSRPKPHLITTFHRLATLKNSSFSGSLISFWALGGNYSKPSAAHSSRWVSSSRFMRHPQKSSRFPLRPFGRNHPAYGFVQP